MGLEDQYPKADSNLVLGLRRLLKSAMDSAPAEQEMIALALNEIADRANDLDEIVQRLLNERHTPVEIGELLIALELTLEQLGGQAEQIKGKLYDIGDRLKLGAATPAAEPIDR